MQLVTVRIEGFGTVEVTSAAMDVTMGKYLPASPSQLRGIVRDRCEGDYWANVYDVSTLLMVLADMDCNVDSCSYSVDSYRACKVVR